MQTFVLGRSLSFRNDIDGALKFRLKDTCHFKEKTNTFYLQSPKMAKLNSVLADYGYSAILDDQGKISYGAMVKARVSLDREKQSFIIHLPEYPSYPLFNRSEMKKWTWRNMTRRLGDFKDPPVYEVKLLYQLIDAIAWLRNEGYEVDVSREVAAYFPPPLTRAAIIGGMQKNASFSLKAHQEDAVNNVERMGWRAVVGDDAGLGKCLSGETMIMTCKGNITTIKELFDESLMSGEFVERGKETLVKRNGIFVPSFDGMKWVPKEVTLFYRERINAPMMTIKTRHGKTVTCTLNHKFSKFDPENGEIWAESSSLHVGDYIAQPLDFPVLETKDVIPDYSGMKLFEDKNGMMQITFKKFVKGPVKGISNVSPMSNDFFEFIGWFTSEGYGRKEKHSSYLSFCQKDQSVRDRFSLLVENIFGVKLIDRPESIISDINSMSMGNYLESIGYEYWQKSSKKAFPHWFLSSPIELMNVCLRSYLDGDGWASKDGYVECTTASIVLAYQISMMFLRNGIRTFFKEMWKSPGKNGKKRKYYTIRLVGKENLEIFNSKVGFSIKKKQDVILQYLETFGKMDNNKHSDNVPVSTRFLSGLRKSVFLYQSSCGIGRNLMSSAETAGRKIGSDKWIKVLSAIIEKINVIKKCKQELQSAENWHSVWIAAKSAGIPKPLISEKLGIHINRCTYLMGTLNKTNTERLIDGKAIVGSILDEMMTVEENVARMLNDGMSKFYDQVIDIKMESARERYVYDLHIDGTHNFVIANGMLCHNTLEGGEIIWRLYNQGKVRRVLWVVPTSPLVYQVRDEMKGRYNLDATLVTGETVHPRERLGIDRKQVVDVTIYEKHGFIITTWSMLVKDFTGKTFNDVTMKVHFDLIILDEGHRSKHGNKAFDAVLNLSAPHRVILSGTIMPNGDWRELHNMVSSVCPSSVMATWYFSNLEDQKAEDFAMMPGVQHPRHEAKKQVTDLVLASLMKRVTRHVKDDHAEFLPNLAEVSMHVTTNGKEEEIISIMIDMLSDIIKTWQSISRYKKGNRNEKLQYMLVENSKNLVWQDLRRFCSHGAFRLRDRMDEILEGTSPVHEWLQENYRQEFIKVKAAFSSGEVRDQPKNPKVLSVLVQAKPERAIIFYNSVKGSIELAKYLTQNEMNVRIIVGSDDQFTPEDADEIGQSSRVKDEEIDAILEWFWFPWKTIANASTIDDGISVTFVSSSGERKERLYYVDGYTLGKKFSIEMAWKSPLSRSTIKDVESFLSLLASSPSLKMEFDPATLRRPVATMTVQVSFTRKKDRRVLVTTDKLNEGANLQVANVVIFYDAPLSIKQKEQRIARARRMNSRHKAVALVNILCGLDYAIERSLGMKYETAKQLGYPDPSPLSMKEVLDMVKKKSRVPLKKQPEITDFIDTGNDDDGDDVNGNAGDGDW